MTTTSTQLEGKAVLSKFQRNPRMSSGTLVLVSALLILAPVIYHDFLNRNHQLVLSSEERVTAEQILNAYDPILNKDLLKERLQQPCQAKLPAREEVATLKERYPKLSRSVLY